MLRHAERRVTLLVVIIALFLMSISSVYAYIDPGTGSYLIQIAAAGILAGLFTVRCFWQSVKNGFARLFGKKRQE